MMSTLRESTTHRGGESLLVSAGSAPIPALGSGPHLFTADQTICQEFNHSPLPISHALISCIKAAADCAFALHAREGGATVSVVHGDMVGLKLFAVSPYPLQAVRSIAI
jgi:hypothetical protein